MLSSNSPENSARQYRLASIGVFLITWLLFGSGSFLRDSARHSILHNWRWLYPTALRVDEALIVVMILALILIVNVFLPQRARTAVVLRMVGGVEALSLAIIVGTRGLAPIGINFLWFVPYSCLIWRSIPRPADPNREIEEASETPTIRIRRTICILGTGLSTACATYQVWPVMMEKFVSYFWYLGIPISSVFSMKGDFPRLGLNRFRLRSDLGNGIVAFLAHRLLLILFSGGLYLLFQHSKSAEQNTQVMIAGGLMPFRLQVPLLEIASNIIPYSILTALIEEFFFRGYLLSRLQNSFGTIAAMTLQCVLFSMAHFDRMVLARSDVMLAFALNYLTFALIAGFIRIRSGSIWAPIIFHALTLISVLPFIG